MTTTPRQPRQKMDLEDGEKREVGSGEAIWRGVKMILAILNPVLAICAYSLLIPVARQRIVKPIWVLLTAVAATFCALLLKALPAYLFIYKSIWQIFQDALADEGAAGLRGFFPALGTWFSAHGIAALMQQLWLAIPVGFLVAAIVATYRARYHADWRKKKKTATPKDVDRVMAKLPKWPQEAEEVRQLADLEILLGVDEATAKPFSLPAVAFAKHAYVDGPSGFGKTTDLITFMRGLVEAPAAQQLNLGLVYVNMKPDPDITESFRSMAAAANRKLHIVTEDGHGATTTYNPLRHGTAEQARNILFEAEALAADGGFSEAHYRRGGERYTLLCMNVLFELVNLGKRYKNSAGKLVPWKRDLPHLARLMQSKNLQSNADLVSPQLQHRIIEYFEELKEDRDLVKSGSGIRQRFASAIEGAAGAVLVEEENGLDLRSAILGGDLVLFNLDAARDAQAARQIGNLAIQDLQAALSELGANKWHKGEPLSHGETSTKKRKGEESKNVQMRMETIIVDEFSALGGTLMQNLFERARSNGGAVVLATQVAEVMKELSPAFQQSVIKNSNIKIFHQQDDDAESYANLIGTDKAMVETKQIFDDKDLLGQVTRHSGQGSLREVDQFIVHPNVLKNLSPGEAIVLIKSPRSHYKVRVRHMTNEVQKHPAKVQDKNESSAAAEVTETAEKPTAQDAPAPEPKEPTPKPVDPWAAAAAAAQESPVKVKPKPAAKKSASNFDDGWDEMPPGTEAPPEN